MAGNLEGYPPLVREFVRASRIIDTRIRECEDSREYLNPIPEENRCGYCFQHLNYSTSETDELLKERQKLPPMLTPIDAPLILKSLEEEISKQKFFDRLKGIEELMDMKTLNTSFQ